MKNKAIDNIDKEYCPYSSGTVGKYQCFFKIKQENSGGAWNMPIWEYKHYEERCSISDWLKCPYNPNRKW